MTGPTNANRVHKDVILKPLSIATCNLTHKVANIPYVKLDICNQSKNQLSTLRPNVIGTSCLNTQKQPSPTNICKPSRSVTKLSHLKGRKSAYQKLRHDRAVDSNNVLANHMCYKCNHLWWKYDVKKCLSMSVYVDVYLCELLLLPIFSAATLILFVIIKKVLFVKMHPTMSMNFLLLLITDLSK